MPHCRFGNFLRFGAADIDDHQPQGASNCGIGAKTVSQGIMPAVDTNSCLTGPLMMIIGVAENVVTLRPWGQNFSSHNAEAAAMTTEK